MYLYTLWKIDCMKIWYVIILKNNRYWRCVFISQNGWLILENLKQFLSYCVLKKGCVYIGNDYTAEGGGGGDFINQNMGFDHDSRNAKLQINSSSV